MHDDVGWKTAQDAAGRWVLDCGGRQTSPDSPVTRTFFFQSALRWSFLAHFIPGDVVHTHSPGKDPTPSLKLRSIPLPKRELAI
jgi:hypothetical protein